MHNLLNLILADSSVPPMMIIKGSEMNRLVPNNTLNLYEDIVYIFYA